MYSEGPWKDQSSGVGNSIGDKTEDSELSVDRTKTGSILTLVRKKSS